MNRLSYLPSTEQVYESFIPPEFSGFPIEKYFASRFNYQSQAQWVSLIRSGSITVNGKTVRPGCILREQDRIVTHMGFRKEPPADRHLEVLYQDRHIRVFNKASPIPVHPCGRYFKNSMTELLKEVYPDEIPRPVQRLDARTTGVIVFARSKEAAGFIMNEFQENRVCKEYLALVDGRPNESRFVVEEPIGKIKGSKRAVAGEGVFDAKPALSEVQWLCSREGRSLLKVIPYSGRTNQIRVHLAGKGLPVINDPIYGKGVVSELQFGLHAHRSRFRCFETFFEFTASCPAHFKPFLEQAPGYCL